MEGRRIYVKHPSYSNSLNHSGTKGMHWGERLYQNKDGSLTPLGRIHYGIGQARIRRAEKAAEKTRQKEERKAEEKRQAEAKKAESDRKKYQNEDGTLNLRGKLHYKTNDKYSRLTDDELKQQTNRLQLQKNLEELKKQTNGAYRLKSKLGSAAEDLTVSGFKRAGEKLINSFIDTSVSKILNTDKENVEKAREFAQRMANMKTNEINAENNRRNAEAKAYELEFGTKPPKGYVYSDLTDEEKAGLKKDRNNPNNQKPSESKENKQKSSESKSEAKPNDQKSSESKPETNNEPSKSKAEPEGVANIKKPLMKEVEEKPSYANIKKPSMKEIKVKRSAPETKTERSERAYGINSGRIKSLKSSGLTISEIAEKLNCSTSTVEKYLKDK